MLTEQEREKERWMASFRSIAIFFGTVGVGAFSYWIEGSIAPIIMTLSLLAVFFHCVEAILIRLGQLIKTLESLDDRLNIIAQRINSRHD